MPLRTESGQYAGKPPSNLAEETGKQGTDFYFDRGVWWGGLTFTNGGDFTNPLAFPGWGNLYLGTYDVYRWMLQHPVLRLVRAICTAPILASSWEYKKLDNSINDSWVDAVKLTFNRLRRRLIADFFINGRDFGWMGGETIWEYKEGLYDIQRVKPLLPEVTRVLEDAYGSCVGLENSMVPTGKSVSSPKGVIELPLPYKAFKYIYDPQIGDHYGRSWLENCRSTAWRQWLGAAQKMEKVGAKISGIVTVITSPAGTFPGPLDEAGNPTKVSYAENAKLTIKALASGAAGVWFPSLGLTPDAKGNIDAMKVLIELAGKSLTNINVIDFSGNAQAITPMLEEMKHHEELMFNAGLRSARTGLEAQHGAKEDAGVHTDTGTVIGESEDEDFAESVQPLVDSFVALNFSPRAAGKIVIRTPSLIDRKTAIFRAMLLSLTGNNEAFVDEMLATVNVDQMFDVLDIGRTKKFDSARVAQLIKDKQKKKQEQQQAKTNSTPEPEGGRPKKE